jgi:hypothetical protein
MRFARACVIPLGRKLRRPFAIQKILSIPYTMTGLLHSPLPVRDAEA